MNPPEDDYEELDEFDKEVMRRLTRIETKLVRFMNHFGVAADGTPMHQIPKSIHPYQLPSRTKGDR